MNFAGLKRRPFTDQEEIDRRRPIYSAPVAPPISKDEWARAQYRAASRAGATRDYFESHYGHSDMQVMDAHVDQIFWQMVRMEMRKNEKFVQQLEFISNYYEVPQHEFLERIKKRYWAQMQLMTDDRKHLQFLKEVFRAWSAAKEAIADVDPARDEQNARRAQFDARAAREAQYEHEYQETLNRAWYRQMADDD